MSHSMTLDLNSFVALQYTFNTFVSLSSSSITACLRLALYRLVDGLALLPLGLHRLYLYHRALCSLAEHTLGFHHLICICHGLDFYRMELHLVYSLNASRASYRREFRIASFSIQSVCNEREALVGLYHSVASYLSTGHLFTICLLASRRQWFEIYDSVVGVRNRLRASKSGDSSHFQPVFQNFDGTIMISQELLVFH